LIRVVVLTCILPAINYFGRVRPAARRRRESGTADLDRNTGADRLDIWVLRVAILSDILGSFGYIFARSEHLFFGSGMMTALGGLGSATTQSVITKHVPADRVGQLLGGIGMMHAIARVVGPVAFNGVYAVTVKTYPQTVFVMLAGLFALALLTTLLIKPFVHWEEELSEEHEPLTAEQQQARDEANAAIHGEVDEIPIE